jgi:predicted PurR-regulated permease PerM
MATALGLIGLVGFIVGVILLAAAITWTVIRITPQRDRAEEPS